MNCNKCNSASVTHNSSVENILYKGQELPVEMDYSVCQDCEREFIATEQIQTNDKRVRIAENEYTIREQEQRLDRLRAENKRLEAVLEENSDEWWSQLAELKHVANLEAENERLLKYIDDLEAYDAMMQVVPLEENSDEG